MKIENFIIVVIVGALLLIITSCKKEALYSDDEPITDINGNIYKTVKIGTQVWMAENLRTTKLIDGTLITNLPFYQTWIGITVPGYWGSGGCTFYNGYSVNTGNLCPTGWHVPTHDELNTLFTYLGGPSVAGDKMKEIGTFNWPKPDAGANNKSGFSATPCGYRTSEGSGYVWLGQGSYTTFLGIGCNYSLTLGLAGIQYNSISELYYNTGTGNVRCIKN
jgi:uncharacterized protein (TIGR02145 family)